MLLSLSSLFLAGSTLVAASALQKRAPLSAYPSGDSIYLGAWISGAQGYSDTPAAFNNRTGLQMPVFQYSQRIPLHPYDYVKGQGWPAFFYLAQWSQTNCNYFLTLYGDEGIDRITDGDLVALASQIAGYQSQGRLVYLRFLPEMQGSWNEYGLQPTAYIALWKRMHTIIRQIAPDTVLVWAPNFSYGYPYGSTLDNVVSQADKTLLDTNNNGQLDFGDDAYAPYYPGDEFVDAAGISIYYKGPNHANINQPQPDGTCAKFLLGIDPFIDQITTNFYTTYCEQKNKECIIAEIGAAYHTNVPGGSSQLDVANAFMNDCIFNTSFYEQFPLIKLINLFEQEKLEEDPTGFDLRDYRLTNVSAVNAAFVAGVSSMGAKFAFATPSAVAGLGTQTAIPTNNPSLLTTSLVTTTIPSLSEAVTWTYTAYSSPEPTGGVTDLPSSASTGPAITGSVTTQAAGINVGNINARSSSALPQYSVFAAFSLLATLGGGLLLLL